MTICTHGLWSKGHGKPGPVCPRCGKRRHVLERKTAKWAIAKARDQNLAQSHETTRRETLGLPPLVRGRPA